MSATPSKNLDTFPNPHPSRDYVITFDASEFTCLCPLTGQPDFAHFTIDYTPDELCVELKSLKLYFWSYRDEGAFHEDVTNTILNDIIAAVDPRWVRIVGGLEHPGRDPDHRYGGAHQGRLIAEALAPSPPLRIR